MQQFLFVDKSKLRTKVSSTDNRQYRFFSMMAKIGERDAT